MTTTTTTADNEDEDGWPTTRTMMSTASCLRVKVNRSTAHEHDGKCHLRSLLTTPPPPRPLTTAQPLQHDHDHHLHDVDDDGGNTLLPLPPPVRRWETPCYHCHCMSTSMAQPPQSDHHYPVPMTAYHHCHRHADDTPTTSNTLTILFGLFGLFLCRLLKVVLHL
ncbi:hypothetical protein SCLCIDRAFT_874615 [Scleroderma citrinum Foug A]|uniref:Uncharacterized protein n=1 Tax=Scleroderma citrinum Foug A TaxID=1036808 RepID=A0A0C3DZ66_9AGAM|nr:hypothetical protein SCLCIDRAFT_874615 [Scleroderma citrinum Foug A]